MFLVPALILFGLIVVYPFIKGVRISLTDWDGFSPIYHYVGLENFKRILKDPSKFAFLHSGNSRCKQSGWSWCGSCP